MCDEFNKVDKKLSEGFKIVKFIRNYNTNLMNKVYLKNETHVFNQEVAKELEDQGFVKIINT